MTPPFLSFCFCLQIGKVGLGKIKEAFVGASLLFIATFTVIRTVFPGLRIVFSAIRTENN